MAQSIFESIKETFTHKVETLDELFVLQLQDLYSAETQLIEALPQMAAAAKSSVLKAGFRSHLTQTREHAARLEKILGSLEKETGGKKCQTMAGLIREGHETISENAVPSVKDAGLIAAAQRVEHYEIAGYGTVRTFATLLGLPKAAALLAKTLKEEADTDKKLTAAAQKLNIKAPRRAAKSK